MLPGLVLDLAGGAFVESGEVGFKLIESAFETGVLALETGQKIAVIGVNFVSQGEIAGANAVAGGGEIAMELGACEWRFVEWLAGQELFGGEQRAGDEGGGGCPEFS